MAGYLANISHDPLLQDFQEADLLALGVQVCQLLDDGGDLGDTKRLARRAVGDEDSANLIVRSAVPLLCSRHERLVEVDLGGVPSPKPSPTGSAREQFLAAVRADERTGDATDDQLLELGTTLCDGFTRGDNLDTTLGYLSAFPRDQAMAFLKATTTHLCPEHAKKVP